MIPRSEFYTALSLALAAASAPQGKESPLEGCATPGLSDMILFDCWPGDRLKIVGTNGRRIAVTTLHLPGAGLHGKYIMSVDKAAEALLTFCPDLSDSAAEAAGQPPRTVTVGFFGVDQLMLSCSGGEDAMMVDVVKRMYPEYNIMLQGGHEPTKDAVYDAHTFGWVLDHITPLAENGVAVHIRQHGPTTFRPQLGAQYRCIKEVVIALKPSHTW